MEEFKIALDPPPPSVLENHIAIFSISQILPKKKAFFLMIICKRPAPLDDHLQEAGPSMVLLLCEGKTIEKKAVICNEVKI